MQIKRTLDTTKANYDIIGLDKEQFSRLLNCYERQMYIYYNGCPGKNSDELLDKLQEMANSDTLIV